MFTADQNEFNPAGGQSPTFGFLLPLRNTDFATVISFNGSSLKSVYLFILADKFF